jgi:hypothetical protein
VGVQHHRQAYDLRAAIEVLKGVSGTALRFVSLCEFLVKLDHVPPASAIVLWFQDNGLGDG